jgi:hypothetical protein
MAMSRVALLLVLAAALAGCSFRNEAKETAAAPAPRGCPADWKPGWQRLANRVDIPVYCPSWMPSPLDASIGGQWNSAGPVVNTDRSYLVGFLWHEASSGDVHVNFRGYPGRAAIPRCRDGKRSIPCFSDPRGTRRVGDKQVTVYTVSRDADQWHVTYVWRRAGTLYTVSEHVAPPLTFRRVVANLDRLVGGLELIRPAA